MGLKSKDDPLRRNGRAFAPYMGLKRKHFYNF